MTTSKQLCTIGFSQKGLRQFIQLLQAAGVTKVIDVRLHNTSQLAGFAKKEDLAFILETFGIEYEHLPDLAPTEEIYKDYKKVEKDWPTFARLFGQLLEARQVSQRLAPAVLGTAVPCLLCAEHDAEHCHRRLVAEHFQGASPGLEVRHLK